MAIKSINKVEGNVMSNNFNDKWLGVLGLSAVDLSKYIVSNPFDLIKSKAAINGLVGEDMDEGVG